MYCVINEEQALLSMVQKGRNNKENIPKLSGTAGAAGFRTGLSSRVAGIRWFVGSYLYHIVDRG
jgi:hypothetical protein